MKRRNHNTTAVESLALPGMSEDIREQEQSAAEVSAEELSAEMRTPKADISVKAGEMERRSPLFFGTGDNPGLFNNLQPTAEDGQKAK